MNTTHATTNGSAAQTGRLMRSMVRRYYQDMAPWASCTVFEIFEIIKNLPFRPDPHWEETLMRPLYTMNMQGAGGDCDDKAIALASWAVLNSIPYRFVAVRRADMPGFHHVFCELYINGRWLHADPTYTFNTLGRQREPYAQRAVI